MTAASRRAPQSLLRRAARATLATGLVALAAACQSQTEARVGVGAGVAIPQASFSEGVTAGLPGLTVQFTSTSTGSVDRYAWDFGPLGTRSEPNPVVTFDQPGSYTVALTVYGGPGSTTMRKSALVDVADTPTAGFGCVQNEGYAPFTISCTDTSVGDRRTIEWDFGDGTTAQGASVSHLYATEGAYTIEQRVVNAGGEDTVTLDVTVHRLEIIATPPSGSPPGFVQLTADTGGRSGLLIWTVDGQVAGSSPRIFRALADPGLHTISVTFASFDSPIPGERTIEYEVVYGAAVADFAPDVAGGAGPLSVRFQDRSMGLIDRWDWEFGDGARCTYPAPAVPDPIDPIPVCSSRSPTHVYEAIGRYDVTLDVSGPGATASAARIQSTTTQPDAVSVYILDASFESQTANAAIDAPWTPLRPTPETVVAEHRAFGGAADAGMPTDGARWAVLEGLGTNGSSPVASVENGLRQVFLAPVDETVIELDYALLYAEPPASTVMDAFTATVSATIGGNTTSVELDGARADVATPYAGGSSRFATRDGATVRATPVQTASLDLATAFPGATPDTLFTLTLRVTNANNGFRSPVAYVDNIRFVEPASAVSAGFSIAAGPVVAGEAVEFFDESCPDPAGGCVEPTSWRWDFDTHTLPTPPAASGSGERDPSYAFPVPGVYEVVQTVRLAQLEAQASLVVTVIAGPTADFAFVAGDGATAPATVQVVDQSLSDPSDPIVAWSWDFAGWGDSSSAAPAPVVVGQAGEYVIRLTITTASGRTNTAERTLTIL